MGWPRCQSGKLLGEGRGAEGAREGGREGSGGNIWLPQPGPVCAAAAVRAPALRAPGSPPPPSPRLPCRSAGRGCSGALPWGAVEAVQGPPRSRPPFLPLPLSVPLLAVPHSLAASGAGSERDAGRGHGEPGAAEGGSGGGRRSAPGTWGPLQSVSPDPALAALPRPKGARGRGEECKATASQAARQAGEQQVVAGGVWGAQGLPGRTERPAVWGGGSSSRGRRRGGGVVAGGGRGVSQRSGRGGGLQVGEARGPGPWAGGGSCL